MNTTLRSELTVYLRVGSVRFERRRKLYINSQVAHWVAQRFTRRHGNCTVAVMAPSLPGLAVSATFYPQCSGCHNPHRMIYREEFCHACWQTAWREEERRLRESMARELSTCCDCGATGVRTSHLHNRRYCDACAPLAWDLEADGRADVGDGEEEYQCA